MTRLINRIKGRIKWFRDPEFETLMTKKMARRWLARNQWRIGGAKQGLYAKAYLRRARICRLVLEN